MKISRRAFLSSSALAAAPVVVPRNVLGKGFVAPSDTPTLLGVGVGGIGNSHMKEASGVGFKPIALCDLDWNHAEKTFKLFPEARKYKDFREALDKEGDKIVDINGYAVNTSTDFSFALFTLPVTEVDGSELSVYKEDCSFDLYVRAAELVDENTTDEQSAEMMKLINEAQSKIADTDSKEAAYSIFSDYYNKLATAAGKEVSKDIPEIEIRDKRQRYRTDMTVIRDGNRVGLKDVDLLTVKKSADDDTPQLQIDFYVEPIEKNIGTVISQTFMSTVSVVRMVWGSLIGLIKGQFSLNDMSGPVGIASAITEVAGESLRTSGFGSAVNSIVYIMMVITINLGIVNMLPFPALDGGRFLMLLIEWIFRKPVPRKVESAINAVGLVLLLGLSAVIAVKDVWKIISGG